uniref:Uncharacterized protein n=1 Tax=Trichobilharzia regenti TaxID=157069 RepID=A0AA85K8M2_TRIRE|nr:unnamed protein product [Trichobilharzia regenti]
MDSESTKKDSDVKWEATVTNSMDKLSDELGDTLTNAVRQVDGELDCTMSDFPRQDICHEFMLVLDKAFMPEFDVQKQKHIRTSQMRFAAMAAAYMHKSVGQCVSQPLRVWLANAASAVILHGLLGELVASVEEDSGGKTRSHGESRSENISLPDPCLDNCQDGNWCYGSWTEENLANASEMRDVLNGEMVNACMQVMVAAVVNYFQERRYTPSGLMKDSYACEVLRCGKMEQYGLTDDSDKTKAMLITGQWVSKLVVFRMATEHRQLKHPLRPVKRIGVKSTLKKMDIGKYFYDVPTGFEWTRLAYTISRRIVHSVCIPAFENISDLTELQKLYNSIADDPFHYHTDAEYLTNSPRTTMVDKANNLFGQLITYLRIFEPTSELLSYPQLCVDGKTREKCYLDYSSRWEDILRVIHSEIYMPSGRTLSVAIKEAMKPSERFAPDEKMLVACWDGYNIGNNVRNSILRYYCSTCDSRLHYTLNSPCRDTSPYVFR